MMKSLLFAAAVASFVQAQGPQSLRIVVLEGEAAVNIIQQKTAVRPLVEVRDRNNVPVAGATVTFTIGTGQPAAFAGGVQTLSVTTNAAGQAAASGFNALGAGTVQIQVQAAYQGQIATAAISQTNVATAAAATQAGGAAGGATGGGGISGTTIGVVGAAVAGGAVAATQLGGGERDGNGDAGTTYTGPVNGQIVVTTTTTSSFVSTCVSTRAINATLKITLQKNGSGFVEATGTVSEVSVAGPLCSPLPGTPYSYNAAVTGGPSAVSFTFESSGTGSTPGGGGSVTSMQSSRFTGALAGGTITGTLSITDTTRGNNVVNGVASTIAGNGSTTIAVTLR